MSAGAILANDRVHVEVMPAFGGRVVRLIDLASGRDWLVPGTCDGSADDDALYLGKQARGWDECFPTVAPCAESVRDHGEIWGRPVICKETFGGIRTTYVGTHYRFERMLSLNGNTLRVRYAVVNTGRAPLPFLWSQHCLLNLGVDDRIDLNGIGPFTVTGVLGQQPPVPTQFNWPCFDETRADLSKVESIESGWAMKAYARSEGKVQAVVEGPTGGIRFEWCRAEIGYLGLWLDYGGWPDTIPAGQVAIEPTTAPADDLHSAMKQQCEIWIEQDETVEWSVRISLYRNNNREEHHEQ